MKRPSRYPLWATDGGNGMVIDMTTTEELDNRISALKEQTSVLCAELMYSIAHRNFFSARSEAELVLARLDELTTLLLTHME